MPSFAKQRLRARARRPTVCSSRPTVSGRSSRRSSLATRRYTREQHRRNLLFGLAGIRPGSSAGGEPAARGRARVPDARRLRHASATRRRPTPSSSSSSTTLPGAHHGAPHRDVPRRAAVRGLLLGAAASARGAGRAVVSAAARALRHVACLRLPRAPTAPGYPCRLAWSLELTGQFWSSYRPVPYGADDKRERHPGGGHRRVRGARPSIRCGRATSPRAPASARARSTSTSPPRTTSIARRCGRASTGIRVERRGRGRRRRRAGRGRAPRRSSLGILRFFWGGRTS